MSTRSSSELTKRGAFSTNFFLRGDEERICDDSFTEFFAVQVWLTLLLLFSWQHYVRSTRNVFSEICAHAV